MKHTPEEENKLPVMTLQRLQQLLDVYGANPERWPVEERAAALALLARSTEAQAQQHEAARFDALLDLAPVARPSEELAARILAAQPAEEAEAKGARNGPRRLSRAGQRSQLYAPLRNTAREESRRRLVWPSLAVAASLAVVLWAARTLTPSHPRLSSDVIANLGVYTTPTDVLLQWPGINSLNTLPSVGCMDAELGCPKLNVPPKSESQSYVVGRRYV